MNRENDAQSPRDSAGDEEKVSNMDVIAEPKNPAGTSSPTSPRRPSSPPTTADDDLMTKVFQFMATATPGTLGAVAAGLAAATYFLLGPLGLILIGAFGGVVLFISWESQHPEVSRAVRGEKGVDILQRLLELRHETRETSDSPSPEEETRLVQTFEDFQPETREALDELVGAVIRDYVNWWYAPIVPADRSFASACQKVLTNFILGISNHLRKKRPADSLLDFVTNSSSMVIVFFSELSAAFAETADGSTSAVDAVNTYLTNNPESNLSNLVNQRQQAAKFKMVAADLLEFVDRPVRDCEPTKVFLREMLSSVILEMTLQTCSKPEWINSWIVFLLEAGEPDFNQAIDVGMQTGPEGNNAFLDLDGNVGNIGLTKGNRNSFDAEKARRKDGLSHKKKLSKADEEMEEAMEEMKRLNQMIAEEDARRAKETLSTSEEASDRLAHAMEKNAEELDIQQPGTGRNGVLNDSAPRSPGSSGASLKDRTSDDLSSKTDVSNTPITPRSTADNSSQNTSPQHKKSSSSSQFLNFDQIVPNGPGDNEGQEDPQKPRAPQPLTLHNASIAIHDDVSSDKGRMRTKPTWDYLIQIEPSSSQHPGWMIVRKYTDFEPLHEVLRRIAAVSGATAFTEQHGTLPNWKVHTRASLRGELERYIRDACWYQSLAESEGMKRFLEKDQVNMQAGSKTGLAGFETFGKNVMGVLSNAPKGAFEGGRAVVGGVTGVFGNIGISRKSTSSSVQDIRGGDNRLSISTPPRMDSVSPSPVSGGWKTRDSLDSQRSSIVSTQPGKMPRMERRPSSQGEPEGETLRLSRSDKWDRPSPSAKNSREHSRASSMAAPLRSPLRSPSVVSLSGMKLPPPPDVMPEDYESPLNGDIQARMQESQSGQQGYFTGVSPAAPAVPSGTNRKSVTGQRQAKKFSPLSEQETRVAVELVFAVINELYTLSSAWNIRRTLLTAAKSFLLRPGNPSLTSIQSMLQSSVLDANISDAGIAAHLRKIRENSLPTEEERKAWPAEMTAEEREKLRVKARKLLIQSGVPAALMGVMGQNATTDALGRVFDCLQVEEISRGLIFGIMLQAVRIITH